METIKIKQEIGQLIESVNDPEILKAVKNLLEENEQSSLKEKMIYGALRSEEDYKAGRIYTREQIIENTNRQFKK
jgi:hypothetical protein